MGGEKHQQMTEKEEIEEHGRNRKYMKLVLYLLSNGDKTGETTSLSQKITQKISL